MNKRKFLKELEYRLNILNEEEVNDIIDEYTVIIDEKVKNGKSETEAIEDFGEFDELVSEILAAYKLNPNYTKPKSAGDKAKDVVDDAEGAIKKAAKKLSNVANNIKDEMKEKDYKFTLENTFELIIKAIILLIVLAILRIPFHLLEGLLRSILYIDIEPLNFVLRLSVSIVGWIAYIGVCALIVVAFFRKHFIDTGISSSIEEGVLKEIKETNPEEYENYKKQKEEKNYETKSNKSTLYKVLTMILKLFLFLSIGLPMICVNLGFWAALAATIYFTIKGINLIGIQILFVGLIFIFSNISYIINKIIFNFNRLKLHMAPFIIGVVLIVTGSIITFDQSMKYEYYNEAPQSNFSIKYKVIEETISSPIEIDTDYAKEIIIDNDLKDNEVVIMIEYYDFISISYNVDKIDNEIDINIEETYSKKHKELFDLFVENLKDYKIYNFTKFFETHTMIMVNENTKDLIR